MKKIAKSRKRAFVGLSGGVDSAVAAALLKKQGYGVTGVFMRFWKPKPLIDADSKDTDRRGKDSNDMDRRGWKNSSCLVESEATARLAAEKIGIPFRVFDFESGFKKTVVDYFLRELRAGRTPNPCVVCNPQIKFGLFLARAKKMGADFVATGHYARLRREFSIFHPSGDHPQGGNFQFSKKSQNSKLKIVKLFRAKDRNKDQSYFLYRLSQGQLGKIIFPLGEYTKEEVCRLAKKWRLPHQARQSFDVCFARDHRGFLKKYLRVKKGKIIKFSKNHHFISPSRREGEKEDEGKYTPGKTGNEVLGQHVGLPFYTIGQRANVGGPGPFFVVKKDVKNNILFVSNNERDLYQKEMLVEKVNWVAGSVPELPMKCKAKIRYGGEAAKARIIKSKSQTTVIFDESQRAITSGQSVVFYGRRGEVLGGGIIK